MKIEGRTKELLKIEGELDIQNSLFKIQNLKILILLRRT